MKNNNNSGFMLMEILVSVAILSIGIVILVQSLSSAIRSNELSGNVVLATLLGQQSLWQIKEKGYDYGVTQGNFGTEYPNFHSEMEAKNLLANLDDIKLKIIWTERGQEKNIQIETLVAKH